MKLIIFGANGPTGRLLTKQALAKGHTVSAFTRHPEAFPIQHDHLRVVKGDVLIPADVHAAVAGQEAVLSTLGVPYGGKTITVFSQGTANIIAAMKASGVRRLAVVSSSATDPDTRFADTGGGFVFEKILKPFFTLVVGKALYDDMLRMETLVRNSGLDWTIVRPSGLFETEAVTEYHTAESHINGRFTSRADLAACLLAQATSPQYIGKAMAVATFSVQPNMLKLLSKEAFGIEL